MLDRPIQRQAISRRREGRLSEIVRNFTPNWFAATMGTGILSIALAQFPGQAALWALGEALWIANIALFAIFASLFAARWVLYTTEARAMLHHPVAPMFLGCIPMGFATIINGVLIFGLPHIGPAAVALAEMLWWIDVAMAFACGIVVPFAMFTRQPHALEHMTAVWLLPLVASEVAAVTGGLLIPHLADPSHQMLVLMVSLFMWSCSVPIALGVLVVLFLRMALHKLPEGSMAASAWLSLGPIGTGALALLIFSQVSPDVLAANGLAALSTAIAGACLLGAILLWGYALWWFAIALVITAHYLRNGISFNLGWWGYTFPLGVFTVCTIKLGHVVHFAPFSIAGATLTLALAVIWCLVASRTVAGIRQGSLLWTRTPKPALRAFKA